MKKLREFFRTSLFKTNFYNGIATAIKILLGIISNKIVAVILGPSGVALLGQLSNFISISSTVSTLGITSGVTKYTAEYGQEPVKRNIIISTSGVLTLGATFLTALYIFL